jgi:hydrogenase/urease accessory protein HupE
MMCRSCFLGIAGCCILLFLVAGTAVADGVPPVQMQVKELPSGAFDVQWSVPKVVSPQAMPSPWLPEQCLPEGERDFVEKPSAWLTRQAYRCPNGLAGELLGIRFPAYNMGQSTLLRVELLSGDQHAHMLNPGEERWRIPPAREAGLAKFYRESQGATLAGIEHFFGGWVHLAFLAVVCLLGGLRKGIRLATFFFVAQVGVVVLSSLLGVGFEAPFAEIGVALATVLLARQALLPPDDRQQLTMLAVCAGAVHGLAIQNLMSPLGQGADPGLASLLFFVLGMDAALLLGVTVISAIGRVVPRWTADVQLLRIAAYGVASLSVALAIGALVDGPAAEAEETQRKLELPSILSPTGSAQPGSRRLASNTQDAAFQSFVSIEAFEVRHEVLVHLRDVAARVGVAPGPELAIKDQDAVKQRIRDLVFEHSSFEIDGVRQEPTSERVDFLIVDATGVLPRPEPVPETIEEAWVGVTTVFLTPTTSRSLEVGWDFIEGAAEIPATVTDPESTRSVLLSPGEPVLRWDNELTEDPAPTVSTTAVEPTELVIPIWSLLPLAAAILFFVVAIRGRKPASSFAAARVILVLAIVLGPLGNVAIALPASAGSTPGTSQAKRILAKVLPNIYRAFEFREEGAVFDRLSMAVTGDVLTDVYLEHRKVLEMEERGGARARVEAVEVIDVDSIEPDDPNGFSARVVWTVGGTVTHFGHRHFRQNRYDARVSLVPDNDIWKIRGIEVFDEERLR